MAKKKGGKAGGRKGGKASGPKGRKAATLKGRKAATPKGRKAVDALLAPVKGATRRNIGHVQLEVGRAGAARVKRMIYPPGSTGRST